jgi:hypothetical protein
MCSTRGKSAMEIWWIIEFAREIKKKGQGGLLEMKE